MFYKRNGLPTSGSIWIFSVFFTFFSSINLYTALVENLKMFTDTEYVTTLIRLPFITWLLTSSSFADLPEEDEVTQRTKNDEGKETKRCFSNQRSPRVYASFPSIFTFSWVTPLTALGFKKSLKVEDLYSLRSDETSKEFAPLFIKTFNDQKSKKSGPGVLKTMFSTLGWDLFLGNFMMLLSEIAQVSPPMLLKWLLQFTADLEQPRWHGFVIVFLMFFAGELQSIFSTNGFGRELTAGLKMRCGLIAIIYRKALALSNSVRKERTVGEIVNLMSTDAERVRELLTWSDLFWSCPFKIIVAVYYIYNELGVATFAGVAILIVMLPLNGWMANYIKKRQTLQMKLKDERVKNMSEILNGIKVIKLYAWEESFMNLVLKIRKKEVRQLVLIAYFNAASIFLWTCTPFMVAVVSFGVFVSIDRDNVLNAEKAFVSLTCFNMLRIPLILLPIMFNYLIFTIVSVKRLNKYLNADELDNYVERSSTGPALSITNAVFSWGSALESEGEDKKIDGNGWKKKEKEKVKKVKKYSTKLQELTITLKNINATVAKGSFTAIVGNVGSGKSSLMSAILGEMEKIKGSVVIGGGVQSIAYVPQQAWIQNVSLKDNILFGCSFDRKQYQQTIEVCELKQDLDILPAGDETEIGEKGINLSGGQKQRVSLARACYSNSDLYLMDDPLSAVDAHVAQNLFDKVLSSKTGILRRKTRVLVTNNLSVLPFVDQILVMKNGSITETGSYNQLMDNNGVFSEYIKNFSDRRECEIKREMDDGRSTLVQRTRSMRQESFVDEDLRSGSLSVTEDEGGKKLIEEEFAETGRVKGYVYMRYLKSMSLYWLVGVIVGSIGNYTAVAGGNYWLSIWSGDSSNIASEYEITGKSINTTIFSADDQRTLRLSVYAIFGVIQGQFTTFCH
jgi:ATP-binding cassette subfamily C (CFTR/MRP) protein 1